MKKFKKSFLYILKISNQRFVNAIRFIFFIKRIINRKIIKNKNKGIIILLLNILNNFINFQLDIKSDEILKKNNKLSI